MRDVTPRFRIFEQMPCISTHTPHAGRDRICQESFILSKISTHTPHAGRDIARGRWNIATLQISTHTPHAGRDHCPHCGQAIDWNFYSHAPCGTWRCHNPQTWDSHSDFYSHAPCGTWPRSDACHPPTFTFLLTRPMRDVTATFCVFSVHIHKILRSGLFLSFFSFFFTHISLFFQANLSAFYKVLPVRHFL